MKQEKSRAYLASPYGFTDCGREFMKTTVVPLIQKYPVEVLNPWDHFDTVSEEIKEIISVHDTIKQAELWRKLNNRIADANEKMIQQSEIIIAVLDGSDVDSGVAAEIGYGYALKKIIVGYRSDIRLTGDNIGATVNIQVEYFIHNSGGEIAKSLSHLGNLLERITQ